MLQLIEQYNPGNDVDQSILNALPDIERYLKHRYGYNDEDAKEATQEVALRGFSHRATLARRTEEERRRYLFRIAKNIALDRFRLQLKQQSTQIDPVDPETLPSASTHNRLVLEELTVTLKSLSDLDQEIIELRYVGGLTTREIAEHLAIGAAAVNGRLYRAMRRLRRLMVKQ